MQYDRCYLYYTFIILVSVESTVYERLIKLREEV